MPVIETALALPAYLSANVEEVFAKVTASPAMMSLEDPVVVAKLLPS